MIYLARYLQTNKMDNFSMDMLIKEKLRGCSNQDQFFAKIRIN